MKKYDAHAHIFPDIIAEKATQSIQNFYSMLTRHVGSIGVLLEESDKAGVEKVVVQSVATTPMQVEHINEFIMRAHKEHPDRLIPFAALHPDVKDLDAAVDRIVRAGFYGIKVHPDFQQFQLDEPRAIRMFAAIGDKLPILVHTGDHRFDFSGPRRMAAALDKVPQITVLCAHLGGWSEFDEAVNCLAGRKNVYVDTSSALYDMTPERGAEVIRTFGVDHVFFGTDFPMWTPTEETARFEALPLTDEEKEMVYAKNLMQFLHID